MVQARVREAADEVQTTVRNFGDRIASAAVSTCTACMMDLDEQLFGIRDGVVSDEAAAKLMKVRKCDLLAMLSCIS